MQNVTDRTQDPGVVSCDTSSDGGAGHGEAMADREDQRASALPAVGSNRRSKPEFVRRLGYYLVGVAMGCVLVGLMMNARARIAANRALAEQAQTEAAEQGRDQR